MFDIYTLYLANWPEHAKNTLALIDTLPYIPHNTLKLSTV